MDVTLLTAPGLTTPFGAKFCFHLAGIGDIVPSIEQPTEYMDVNVQGTVRILESARLWPDDIPKAMIRYVESRDEGSRVEVTINRDLLTQKTGKEIA